MTLLASGEGALVWAVIAVGVWIFKAIQKAVEKGSRELKERRSKAAAPREMGERMRGLKDQLDPEEERTRKFLEALGLPPDKARPLSAPTVLRPTTDRAARGEMPVPPIFAPPPIRQARELLSPKRSALPTLPREARRPVAFPGKLEENIPRTWTQQADSIQEVRLPGLETPSLPEYQTYASRVSAIPGFAAENPRLTVSALPLLTDFRELVRHPEALRSALVLREILGPPRSLQSFEAASSLHVL